MELETKDYITIVGTVLTLFALLKGIFEYQKAQIWKRSEFIAQEIKDFFADHMVKNSLLMLDWEDRLIELYPSKSDYKERLVYLSRKDVTEALIPIDEKDVFTDQEVAIRDNFDIFLSYIERFENFVQLGLIQSKELEPYLRYWIKEIAEERKTDDDSKKKLRSTLHRFIDYYEYEGVQNFFDRFGKNIRPKS